MDYRPTIAITMGDPAGIGPEVIVKALADPQTRDLGRFIVYGIEECLAAAADAAGIRPFWFTLRHDEPPRVDTGVVVANFDGYAAGHWLIARPTAQGGGASLRFLDSAIQAARTGALDAIAQEVAERRDRKRGVECQATGDLVLADHRTIMVLRCRPVRRRGSAAASAAGRPRAGRSRR